MKKKVLLALAAAMAITSVSFASPLSNYEKGSVAFDLNTSISSDVEIDANNFSRSIDAKNRLGAGITYGIGDNLALKYKYSDNKSKDFNLLDSKVNAQLIGHELNVLYQIDPNVSAFVGYTRSTGKINFAGSNLSENQSKSGYHVGIIGQTRITDDVTAWASVSAGNRVTGYEIGIGYDVAQNTELNLFYRHTKYKDFNALKMDVDFTTKGLGAGVTFRY